MGKGEPPLLSTEVKTDTTCWSRPVKIQKLTGGTLPSSHWKKKGRAVRTLSWVRTRIQLCTGTVSLWESWFPVCKVGQFHRGTVPHPVDPTGFHSCGGSRALVPPWGWAALPGLYQTLQLEESLCWMYGRGTRRCPGFVRFLWVSLPAKIHHSEPVAKAEVEPQSQGFWGVREHSADGELEGTPHLDLAAEGPHDSLLSNLWNHLLL